MARLTTNRVVDDRLWDDQGLVWMCNRGSWATADQARALLKRDRPVFVHGPGIPSYWMTKDKAAAWWSAHQKSFEVPGTDRMAEPDEQGYTYAAKVWRRDDERLLSIHVFC